MLSRSPKWGDRPLLETREDMERNARRLKMAKGVEVSPTQVEGVPAEWIRPAGARNDKAMLYLHGGGYCMGSCDTHRPLVSRLAKAGDIDTLSIAYRLAPEHPFPAAFDDATAAYDGLLNDGYAPDDIVVAGDSAGGALAVALCISLRDNDMPLPAAVVCISPWIDLKGTGESIRTRLRFDPVMDPNALAVCVHYVGDNDPCSPSISPLYGDLTGFPRMLIHVGTDEILLSDSTRLADKAREAGVDVTLRIWDDMWHVFHFWAALMPEADEAIADIGAFVKMK